MFVKKINNRYAVIKDGFICKIFDTFGEAIKYLKEEAI
jgi:hypothetical protein